MSRSTRPRSSLTRYGYNRDYDAFPMRLAPHNFARVHKACLVNLDHIAEVVPWFSGNYLIRMNDASCTEIPMSRRYAAQLKKLTGWR